MLTSLVLLGCSAGIVWDYCKEELEGRACSCKDVCSWGESFKKECARIGE